jgi:hypothetical protein
MAVDLGALATGSCYSASILIRASRVPFRGASCQRWSPSFAALAALKNEPKKSQDGGW